MFLRSFKETVLSKTAKKFQKRLPLIFVFISSLFLTQTAQAAPGDLDLSFGVGGKVVTPIGNFNDEIRAIAIQPDGKIIAAGSRIGTISDFTLVRYNTNGSLDTTFGTGGIVITQVSGGSSGANSLVIQTDGKIVAGGYRTGAFRLFVLIRYNTDGSLDPSFGKGGIVTTQLGSNLNGALSAINLQPDGKIVAVGGTFVDFALARYNTDGSLDTSFGTGGIVITSFSSNNDFAAAVTIQPDGKIIAAGRSSTPSTGIGDFALARYHTNGSLDASFGDGGKVVTPFSNGNFSDAIEEVLLQTDGRIVAVGSAYNGSEQGIALIRYNTNGSLDSNFGNGGKVLTTFSPSAGFQTYAFSAVIQPDGKIIAAGQAGFIDIRDFALARYNTNGSLDISFGNGGKVTTDFNPTRADQANALAIQSDGKIVAAGYTPNGTNNDFALARYLAASNVRSPFDFDGDGKADVSVFRPSNGAWYLLQSQNGFTGVTFGISTDRIVPADYDGDGKTDVAVYRNGTWYLQRSTAGFLGTAFGEANDIPQPADFDGDGKAELAVWRPSNGTWYVLNLVNNQFTAFQFGAPTDKPVAADYDGDGKADYAVYRSGVWYVQRSQLGFTGITFGDENDKPIPADYDGDGKADVAVFRPSSGTWYLLQSTAGFTGLQFGLGTDLPVPADYDGDGKTDVAVFRNGTWYLQRSQAGFTGVPFGTNDDKPIPNAFVP